MSFFNPRFIKLTLTVQQIGLGIGNISWTAASGDIAPTPPVTDISVPPGRWNLTAGLRCSGFAATNNIHLSMGR